MPELNIDIDYTPVCLNGQLRAELVAKRSDVIVHIDSINLASATSRNRFVKAIQDLFAEIDVAALHDELIRIAAELREEAGDGQEPRRAVAIAGEKIMAEVAIVPNTGELGFLIYDVASRRVTAGESVEAGGVEIYPPTCAGLCTSGFGFRSGCVLLPTGVQDYGDEAALIAEVRAFIHRYVELREDDEAISAYYVLFTYLHDRFDELPYRRTRNPDYGRGKSRDLETVGSICYRPMFAGGGSTAAAMRRIIDLFRGTLIGDEQDSKGDSELTATCSKILCQGFQRGRPLVVCDGESNEPRPFYIYGPKLLASRRRFDDDAVESRCLTISIEQRTRKDIPKNLPRLRFDAEALELRNKLTLWRFHNWHRAKLNPALEVANVEDRLNQIAVPLLSIVRDETVQASIR